MESPTLGSPANRGECPEVRASRAPKQHLLRGVAAVDDTPGLVTSGKGNVGWTYGGLGAFTIDECCDSLLKLFCRVESRMRRSCHGDFLTPKHRITLPGQNIPRYARALLNPANANTCTFSTLG